MVNWYKYNGSYMEVLILILPLALLIAILFIVAFIYAAKNGQLDDLDTPQLRLLIEDKKILKKKKKVTDE